MADHKTCDHCGKEIVDPSTNIDMTQLTTWEGEGGSFDDGIVEEINRDFCNMKCTAQFTHAKLLEKVNGPTS